AIPRGRLPCRCRRRESPQSEMIAWKSLRGWRRRRAAAQHLLGATTLHCRSGVKARDRWATPSRNQPATFALHATLRSALQFVVPDHGTTRSRSYVVVQRAWSRSCCCEMFYSLRPTCVSKAPTRRSQPRNVRPERQVVPRTSGRAVAYALAGRLPAARPVGFFENKRAIDPDIMAAPTPCITP